MLKVQWTFPLVVVSGVLGWWLLELRAGPVEPSCAPIVEVVRTGLEPALACPEDLPSECRSAGLGDRVEVSSNDCKVTSQGMSAAARLVLGLPLLLNQVSAEDLQLLDGVGEKTAASIIDKREALGRFRSLEDLLSVDGIGEKRLEALRPLLRVSKSRESPPKDLDLSTDGD